MNTELIVVVMAVFLVAGMVKGVVGMGLPTISLALLVIVTDLTSAMTLLVLPSLVTNLWQGLVGGHLQAMVKRLWPFLLLAATTVILGASLLTSVQLDLLAGLLGLLLVIYSVLGLSGIRLRIEPTTETWLGPVTGMVNGALTGMTGSFVVPGVFYLQALGLSRDELVQAMGLLFTVSTVALALALFYHGVGEMRLGLMSAIAVIPALLGMVAGAAVRRRITEGGFQRLLFISILILGLFIMWRNLEVFCC